MNMSPQDWRGVRAALGEAIRGWIYDPNVTLIDYGWPEHDGTLARDEAAIRVHVVDKLSPVALEAATEEGITRGPIPDTFAGIPSNVRQIGRVRPQQWWGRWWQRPAEPRRGRADPMQGGISISNAYTYGYGTLGGLVTDRESGARMMLSNWHVLAALWHAQPGWAIYQPGRGDGGAQADMVARLAHHAMSDRLDAAVAELTGSRELVNEQFGLGPVQGVGWAQFGMEVVKSGRRTGVTYGRVTGVEGTARLPYRGVYRLIRNVMTIEPRAAGGVVSAGGDSGSFWLDEETMHAVGLHFAGGDLPERALAIDMQPILDALDVDLVI